MSLHEKGRAFLARLTRLGILCGVALLALMACLVVLQVAARNFFDLGLPWADELARFSSIGLVFLGVPCLAGRQVLIAVTMLPDACPPKVRGWMSFASDIATLIFAAFLLQSFAEYLPRAGKFLTPAMQVSNWVYYSLALVGHAVLALVALDRVIAALSGRPATAPYHDPRDDSGLPT